MIRAEGVERRPGLTLNVTVSEVALIVLSLTVISQSVMLTILLLNWGTA